MHYKTICLELLEQRPAIHELLRRNRIWLPTLERVAQELKTRHDEWKDRLSLAKPHSDRSQIASEALELALKELEDCLPFGSLPDATEPLTVEAAMAFMLRHTPPA